MRFDDRRAARDRKAATRRLWRSAASAGGVPVSMVLATLVLETGKSFFCTWPAVRKPKLVPTVKHGQYGRQSIQL